MPEPVDNRASQAEEQSHTPQAMWNEATQTATPLASLAQNQTDRIVIELAALRREVESLNAKLEDVGLAVGEAFWAAGDALAMNHHKQTFALGQAAQQRVVPINAPLPPAP